MRKKHLKHVKLVDTLIPSAVDNQDSSGLLGRHIPADMRMSEIYAYFSIADHGVFAQTCKKAKSETDFFRLLPATINAIPAHNAAHEDVTALASINLLKNNPELLFRKKLVTDHYGRHIYGSPYQLFLGAGDVWAIKQIHQEILPLIEHSEAEAEAQFKEQFPNCPWPIPENLSEEMLYDDRNKQQVSAIVEQLAVVKTLIENNPFSHLPDDKTKQAIETLCKLFQPESGKVIRSGLHFPLAIMEEINKTYVALTSRVSHFLTLAIIKPAQDALSTVDGQCCQNGLKNLDVVQGPSRRCHSSYQQPTGKPLSLKLVNINRRNATAAVVDPVTGDVLVTTHFVPNSFECFSKDGKSESTLGFRSAVSLAEWTAELIENKCKTLSQLMRPRSTVSMSISFLCNP